MICTLVTLSAESPIESTLTVNGALVIVTACVLKFKLVGFNAIAGAVPLPVTATLTGFTPELLKICKVEARAPSAVGLNNAPIVQVVPGGIEPHRLLVTMKSPALPPLNTALVIARVAFPPLLTVTLSTKLVEPSGWLPKFNCDGATNAVGDVFAPTPVRFTTCGELVALPNTTNCAVRLPNAVGVKVTISPQELPGGTRPPHPLPVTAKSAALVPMICTLVTLNEESPIDSTLTVNGALAIDTACVPNASGLGCNAIAGATPLPVTATLSGLTPELLKICKVEARAPNAVGRNT